MEDIQKSIQDSFDLQKEWIEKSIEGVVGEIRFWGGERYQKQSDKSWKRISLKDTFVEIDNLTEGNSTLRWLFYNMSMFDQTSIPFKNKKFIYKSIYPLKSKYKIKGDKYWLIDLNDNTKYAGANSNTMELNPYYFIDLDAFEVLIDKDIRDNHHPKVKNKIQSLIYHEFSHSLTQSDIKFKSGSFNELSTIYNEYVSEVVSARNKIKDEIITLSNTITTLSSGTERDTLISGLRVLSSELTELTINNNQFVSEYAEQDVDEFTSECFAMTADSDCKNKYALKVKQVINKYYKK